MRRRREWVGTISKKDIVLDVKVRLKHCCNRKEPNLDMSGKPRCVGCLKNGDYVLFGPLFRLAQ
jgi:hypothetical protein